jgi:hypothetical protein
MEYSEELKEYIGRYDVGIFTFFDRDPYTDEENADRQKNLTAKLKCEGFTVFVIERETATNFIIIDEKGNGTLPKRLPELAEYFGEHDGIYISKDDSDSDSRMWKDWIDLIEVEISKIQDPGNGYGFWARSLIAKRHWSKLYD